MRWGVPKQKRHCAAYGGISHKVIIVQKHKDFVIDVGQVIYQHRHDRMRMEAFRVTDRLSDSDRTVLMGETVQRVYNWAPS